MLTNMDTARRIVVLLAICALGLGMPLDSAQSGEMSQHAMEATAEQPPSGNCEACGDGEMAAFHSPCAVSCTEARLEAHSYGPSFGSSNIVWALSEQWPDGSASSPEPHPPRLIVLA